MDIQKDEPGVYQISCIKNKKMYIGKSKNLTSRINGHKSNLKSGIDRCRELQKDFDLYGIENFIFEVIFEVKEEFIEVYESILIELFINDCKMYNFNSGQMIKKIKEKQIIVPDYIYKDIFNFLFDNYRNDSGYVSQIEKLNSIRLQSITNHLINETDFDETEAEILNTNATRTPLFNEKFKKHFLRTVYSEETQRFVRWLLGKISVKEKQYNKDLYNFTYAELAEVLASFKSPRIRSLQNINSKISRYIDFAMLDEVESKKIVVKYNYSTLFDSNKKLSKYIIKCKLYFKKNEIMKIAKECENAQDGIILGLLFDGLSYKNGFQEIRELTQRDIVIESNEINLENRVVIMSNETAFLLKNAIVEDTYFSIIGEKTRKYRIASGENIVRGIRKQSKVNGQIINQRLIRVSKYFSYDYLNGLYIVYSGQIHNVLELLSSGVDMDKALELVLERYGFPVNSYSKFYLKNRIRDAELQWSEE